MNCLIFMQPNDLCSRALKLARKRKHCRPKLNPESAAVKIDHQLSSSLQKGRQTKKVGASRLSNNISLSPPSICFLGLLMRPQVWTQAEQTRGAMGENWDAPRVWLYASSRGQTNSSMGRYGESVKVLSVESQWQMGECPRKSPPRQRWQGMRNSDM